MAEHWSKTEEGKAIVKKAFEALGLPEVEEKDLEVGTYTNLQIAEKMNDPITFATFLMRAPDSGSNASIRSILSFAVDML